VNPFLLSLQTAIVATSVAFVLGIVLARWRLTAPATSGLIVDGLMMLPIALPPTVVGLGLLLLFGPSSPVGGMVDILFSWPATVLAAFVVSFPLMYLTARAAFEQVDHALVDLARTYGYSEMRILWAVMLPLAWPGVASACLLTFVRCLGEFGATMMVAGNIPGRTQTLPLAIFFRTESGDLDGALSLSLVSFVLSFLAVLLLGALRPSRRR
jgi:molybdate transport system permease protein